MTEPTPRQLQVLVAYIECGTIKAAAYELGLREPTVRNHLDNLRAALGVSNSAQAFAVAVQRGLIRVEDVRLGQKAA